MDSPSGELPSTTHWMGSVFPMVFNNGAIFSLRANRLR